MKLEDILYGYIYKSYVKIMNILGVKFFTYLEKEYLECNAPLSYQEYGKFNNFRVVFAPIYVYFHFCHKNLSNFNEAYNNAFKKFRDTYFPSDSINYKEIEYTLNKKIIELIKSIEGDCNDDFVNKLLTVIVVFNFKYIGFQVEKLDYMKEILNTDYLIFKDILKGVDL